MGSSGCGKSTLIQLLMGFYAPIKRDILLDGKQLAEYPIEWVRDQIGRLECFSYYDWLQWITNSSDWRINLVLRLGLKLFLLHLSITPGRDKNLHSLGLLATEFLSEIVL